MRNLPRINTSKNAKPTELEDVRKAHTVKNIILSHQIRPLPVLTLPVLPTHWIDQRRS
jgi:hypothetical protein